MLIKFGFMRFASHCILILFTLSLFESQLFGTGLVHNSTVIITETFASILKTSVFVTEKFKLRYKNNRPKLCFVNIFNLFIFVLF